MILGQLTIGARQAKSAPLLYSQAKAKQIDVECQIYKHKHRWTEPTIVSGQFVSAEKRLCDLAQLQIKPPVIAEQGYRINTLMGRFLR